ncbi:YjgN family protein [Hydrogenophaga sp. SNF1]|uniref:YjgN family protein n=1 Tax=Hydrogenophaga sp. SNF1 TaxID=3098762 RepID=UPI002ACC38B1|nr:YjgN family protein [Hydrogenophaga sp. SNF1]WQB82373.1 YjgN family protein [Hydrogenophaga sp. SNF1]
MNNIDRLGEAPGAQDARPQVQTLPIRFTGSGSEYFRIWIVNLLLVLVTFTLYWPFARARRLTYFQNNTLVGDDPLGFHANPWKMFRGYLVVALFGLAYGVTSETAPLVAGAIFLVFALLWPALWRASLQFRLRNTSWRGVRLSFEGDLKGAYLAFAPLLLPVLGFVALGLNAPDLAPGEGASPEERRRMGLLFLGVMALFALVMPWCLARIKQYQHGGYRFAGERTELRAGVRQFYGLGLRSGGVMLLVVLIVGAIAALGVGLAGRTAAGVLMLSGAVALGYLLFPMLVVTHYTAALQNLVWQNTRSRNTRFRSGLGFGALARVTAVNWLLIALTLGLYWPFAQVRLARARLEAMALQVKGSVNDWLAHAQRRDVGPLGDAAGDFFGIDMGL